MRNIRVRRAVILWGLALVVCIVAVYAPGLHGPFLFDDYTAFVDNPLVKPDEVSVSALTTAAFADSRDALGRPLSFLSFAANYLAADGRFDPFQVKATNLAIHLANALLVGLLAERVLRRLGCQARATTAPARNCLPLVLLATALWALHPVQLTAVLYSVQRMTSLSALVSLVAILAYLHGRTRLPQSPWRYWVFMVGAMATGVLVGFGFKENAALIPLYCLVLDLALFDDSKLPVRARRVAVAHRCLMLAGLALVCLAAATVARDYILSGYALREFSLTERVLTQARVLFAYIGWIAVPLPGHFGLFHDDIALSHRLLDPWSTLPAVLAWCAAAAFVAIRLHRGSLFAFGLAWFLTGHALESSVIGLEMAFEHRNYLPSVGLIVAGVGLGAQAWRRLEASAPLATAAAVLLVCVVAAVTVGRAFNWQHRVAIVEVGARNHPDSARYHSEMGVIEYFERGDPVSALEHLEAAASLAPGAYANLLLGYAIATAESAREPAHRMASLIESRIPVHPVDAATIVALRSVALEHWPPVLARPVRPDVLHWAEKMTGNHAVGRLNQRRMRETLALLYRAEGDLPSAEHWLRRELEGSPLDAYARLLLAEVLIEQGRPNELADHIDALRDGRRKLAPVDSRVAAVLESAQHAGVDSR